MITLRSLPLRNLQYHRRGNLAVLLGVAVGAAVLTGALFVGDSLRGSLRDRAERQLNGVTASWVGGRFVRDDLAARLPGTVTPAIYLQGSATGPAPDKLAHVAVVALSPVGAERFGLPVPAGWAEDKSLAVLSRRAADVLGVAAGGKVELSVQRFSAVPRSSFLGKRSQDDVTTAIEFTVAAVLEPAAAANDFSLVPNPAPPVNVFVPLGFLQRRFRQEGKINAFFGGGTSDDTLNTALTAEFTPADAGVRVSVPVGRDYVSVEAEQLVLDPATVAAVESAAKELGMRSERTAVYLANRIGDGKRSFPYSVVAGLDPTSAAPLGPFLPTGLTSLKDDEIVLAEWPESPLKDTVVGAKITLEFFRPEVEAGAVEETAAFRLAGRVPLAGPAADKALTPPFPGITDKATIANWDPPFPYDNTRIKPGDVNERFWNKYRATPKAYLTFAAAEKLFGSRFGVVTSIRVAPTAGETPTAAAKRLESAIARRLPPRAAGVAFEPTRDRLLAASGGSNDFAGLFLAFSFVLIVSALLLVGLLFRLNVERRAKEIGFYLASGYAPRQVRRMLLVEGLAVAVGGSVLGLLLAIGYSHLLVAWLAWVWPDGAVRSFLAPHTSVLSFAAGFGGSVLMAGSAILFSLRGLAKVSPPALLRGVVASPLSAVAVRPGRRSYLITSACFALAAVALALGVGQQNPDIRAMSFFGGGGLILTGGLLVVRTWLNSDPGHLFASRGARGLLALGRRNAGRAPGRSLLTVALLAGATFLLVAVESFRRSPDRDFADRTGGSGGFNLVAEADVPVFQPFDRKPGRGDLLDSVRRYHQDRKLSGPDLDAKVKEAAAALDAVTAMIPVRVRGGDDASCLNLYRAGRPRVVGVPDELIARGGFRFAETTERRGNPWELLRPLDGPVPVFLEQNSAMWMLKVGPGDPLELPDAGPGRVAATLQDSVFQSELVVHDDAFRRLYPREEGYRLFLIETPPGKEAAVIRTLETGLRGSGLVVTASRDRVAGYQAVVGTYLSTFQLLGGLGLVLGVGGVAVVVLRGVWERAAELALLRAVGYTTGQVRLVVLGENLLLIVLGLGLGLAAALLSVAPHAALGGVVPWRGVLLMAAGVFLTGGLVVVLATAGAAKGSLVPALRKD